MYSRVSKSVRRAMLLAAAVAAVSVPLIAQQASPAKGASADYSASKWDIFAGYSYIAPKATINVPQGNGTTLPVNFTAITPGGIVSIARYFNKYVGVELSGDIHLRDESQPNNIWVTPKDDMSGGGAGLIFRYPTHDVTPFVHALVGGERVGGPHWQPEVWGPALTVGGGMDYSTPLFGHHLAIRVFQADYQYIHANYGPVINGGRANINAARLSAGVVIRLGSFTPPTPLTLACALNTTNVMVQSNNTVIATATPSGGDPHQAPVITWSGVPGMTGSGETVSINPATLQPGTYTVHAAAKQGKGTKPGENAECSASFTVGSYSAPTVSCVANPSTIYPGQHSTITTTADSAQNLTPFTYGYSASEGTINGNGSTADFDSTGAGVGVVTINCDAKDSRGTSAEPSGRTTVTIIQPATKECAKVQQRCSINFDTPTTAKKAASPVRVNNEAKACLDMLYGDLTSDTQSQLVLVGQATSAEKAQKAKGKKAKVQDLAAQRAVNAKDYLVGSEHTGIASDRVIVRTGDKDAREVDGYLLPSVPNCAATFNDFQSTQSGTQSVNEPGVKVTHRQLIGEPAVKTVHHKAAKKAAK